MTCKYISNLFIILNLAFISKSYSITCPVLNEDHLKILMNSAAANKDDDLRKDSSRSVFISGGRYRMKYSSNLANALSSVSSSRENKIKIESTQKRSEIQKIEGPQPAQGHQQMPSIIHVCKYKVSVPKVVYEPLAGDEEVEIYTLK